MSRLINAALDLVQKTHQWHWYKVYCDRSSYEGGVGTAVVLYKHNRIIKTSVMIRTLLFLYLTLTPPWLTFWLTFLTTVYFTSHLLHHDSRSDSLFSQMCTLSPAYSTMTHNFPYLRNVYIDLGICCKYPNLALLKYTWVPGQVPLGTFILISQYYWDIPLFLILTVSKKRHSQHSSSQVLWATISALLSLV